MFSFTRAENTQLTQYLGNRNVYLSNPSGQAAQNGTS